MTSNPEPDAEPCGQCECCTASGATIDVYRVKLSAALEAKAQAEAKLVLVGKRFVGGGDLVADIDDLLLSEHNLRERVRTLTEALQETTKAMAAARDRGFIPTYLLAAWETCLQSGRAAFLKADAGQGGEP